MIDRWAGRSGLLTVPLSVLLVAGGLAACSYGDATDNSASAGPGGAISDATAPVGQIVAGASSWLADQLTDGTHMITAYENESFDDVGLTIDTLWALTSTGVAASAVGPWLADAAQVESYTGAGEAVLAGATAKLALVLGTPGVDPGTAGTATPSDLETALIGRLQESGQFTDGSSQGDYSNPIGQSLAILALARDGRLSGLPADPAAFLAAQACPDGSFPPAFTLAGAIDGAVEGCQGSVDSTALSLQALAVAGGQEAAVNGAKAWLLEAQGADGAWADLDEPSVNSTALAAQALRDLDADAAGRGRSWLASVQNEDGGYPVGAEGESDARATAQAVPAVAGLTFAEEIGLR
jgi:hypothetical protein